MKKDIQKFKKQNRGITLIALIITIIVLLILAGVTISMLTGSDSAPAKANEAKQKDDIGALKDEISLFVQNKHMELYDDIYVKTNTTTSSISGSKAKIGSEVISAVNTTFAYSGNSKKGVTVTLTQETATSDAVIELATRDFKQPGTISYEGGTLLWQALVSNDGTQQQGSGNPQQGGNGGGGQATLPENAVQTLAQAGTIKVGDYVNYTPSSGEVTVTAAQTGANDAQTFSTANNTGMTWRVLSVNDSTGEVKIVGSPTTQQLTLYGKAGFGNAETVLNSVAGIYGGGIGAASVRSITEDDIFDAIGYDKAANYSGYSFTFESGEFFTETWNSTTGTATYSTTTTTATAESPVTLHNTGANGWIITASNTIEDGSAEEKANMQVFWDMLFGGDYEKLSTQWDFTGCFNYWCASRFVRTQEESEYVEYYVRYVKCGGIVSGLAGGGGGAEPLYEILSESEYDEYERTHAIVPVVTLQSNIEIEQDTSAGETTWNFVQ